MVWLGRKKTQHSGRVEHLAMPAREVGGALQRAEILDGAEVPLPRLRSVFPETIHCDLVVVFAHLDSYELFPLAEGCQSGGA